jgi:hypothetical protein
MAPFSDQSAFWPALLAGAASVAFGGTGGAAGRDPGKSPSVEGTG